MILQNAAKCNRCGEEIWSEHRHDYRECKCGSIAVDGGTAYLRRVGEAEAFDDRSIIVPADMKEQLKFAVAESRDLGRNDLGTALAVLRVLQKRGVVKSIVVADVEQGASRREEGVL